MGRYEECLYFDNLYEAVNNCFPEIGRDSAQTILREVILAPTDYVVEFNDSAYDKNQMAEMIADELTKQCINETPQNTFITLIEQVAEIIKHMNDGYISHEDYMERNNFLHNAERDEFILFTAYAFRQAAQSSNERQLEELKLNIVRYREFQDLIVNYTRDAEDIETDRSEFEMARPIYKMLKSLQTLGYDYNFSPKERAGLGIDHEDDEDLTDKFNYINWLKRIMLLELRKELSASKEKTTETVPVNDINDKIAQLRGIYQKRGFDSTRFNMLKNNNDFPKEVTEQN